MKKIIIPHYVLVAVLKRLKQVIPTKATVPALENIYFEIQQAGNVKLTASDLELTIQQDISCEYAEGSEEAFVMLIPFDFLNKIVSVTESGPVTLELKADNTIDIITGNDYFCCGTMVEVSEYPNIPAAPKKNTIELAGIVETLNNAIPSVSKDSTRPAMCNVCLHIGNEKITVAATNAHVLFSKIISTDTSKYDEMLLISPKAVKALEGFKNTRIAWSEKFICFQSDSITVISTRFKEKYPDYRMVFPPDPNSFMQLDKKDLLHALDKCNISDNETKTTVLTMAADKLHLESTSYEDGKAIKTEVECEYTGKVEKLCLNSKLLHTLVNSISSESLPKNPRLKLSNVSPSKPTVITAVEDETFQLLIMPIMLNN